MNSITDEAFYDSLIESGAYFIWYFHYMPIGNDADVSLLAPGLLAGDELNTELIGIILDLVAAGVTHYEHVIELLLSADAVGIVDVTVGTGKGDDLSAELHGLGADAPGNVAETGDRDRLPLNRIMFMLQNFHEIIDCAPAGCFGTSPLSENHF